MQTLRERAKVEENLALLDQLRIDAPVPSPAESARTARPGGRAIGPRAPAVENPHK
jgi:hypothetical protein